MEFPERVNTISNWAKQSILNDICIKNKSMVAETSKKKKEERKKRKKEKKKRRKNEEEKKWKKEEKKKFLKMDLIVIKFVHTLEQFNDHSSSISNQISNPRRQWRCVPGDAFTSAQRYYLPSSDGCTQT